jgi:di/tricarboxylate transporter
MTPHIALVLLFTLGAIAIFAWGSVPTDVVALGVMLALILSGILTSEESFAGFGSNPVLMIFGLLVMTAALLRTGVVEAAARAIEGRVGTRPGVVLVAVMVAAAAIGAVISNTASTAFFLPIVVNLARRMRIDASKLLMPLAFASILTSSVTVISTSSNVIVSGLIEQAGMPAMGMFELAPLGIPIAVLGIAYMLTVGRRLIPNRGGAKEATDEFGLRAYLTEVVVLPRSPLVGSTLAEGGLGRTLDLTVLRVVRGRDQILAPRSNMKLMAEDVLLVEGKRSEILRVKDTAGIEIRGDFNVADADLKTHEIDLVEAILMPGSPLIGRTLRGYRLREEHGLQVLAIHRYDETLREKLSGVRLRMGDILLVQGQRSDIASLEENGVIRVLGAVRPERVNPVRARVALAAFGGSILLGTLEITPLPVAVLLGAMVVFLGRCITPQEAYREVEWRALIVIGAMLALGTALARTGAAEYLAAGLSIALAGLGPVALLGSFFLLTVGLTQAMGHQAATVVVMPVALSAASALGANPRPFAMMVAVAASCSFLTPLEPACLIVSGPGHYRFRDFAIVGLPLALLIFLLAVFLVPRVWPL